ncbi:CST complex subunit Ten1 [Coniella lustricola]|uniref:CST complex subunit Ten1 n=1 Tax=Coniella lustricola TaxID=2025994 RepID=A0A2T3AHI9_9PEZI|nr:CST complex subunit Ten1 [Coniella lustricola]
MAHGPVPSRLTLLASLPSFDWGTKVRFLGCVTSYSAAAGRLVLEHDCPKSCQVKAWVDVRLLLEKLTFEHTAVGQWVNVIGYITLKPQASRKHAQDGLDRSTVDVQALMLWSAGPLDIERYETCLSR